MKRLAALFFATLIMVALILHYWWVIALAVAAVAVIVGVIMAWRDYVPSAERIVKREAALAARAEQQHQWVMQGDPRGTFGDESAAAPR